MQEVVFSELEGFLRKSIYSNLILEIRLEDSRLVLIRGEMNSCDFKNEKLKIEMKTEMQYSSVFIDLTKIKSIHTKTGWFFIKLKENIEYRITDLNEEDL